jgi:hypothetical protein
MAALGRHFLYSARQEMEVFLTARNASVVRLNCLRDSSRFMAIDGYSIEAVHLLPFALTLDFSQ